MAEDAPPLTVRGGLVLTPREALPQGTVCLRDGLIDAVLPFGSVPPPADFVLDASDCTVVPGFIDLQLNGTGGIDCMRANASDLARLCALLPPYGCTAFLPTLVTAVGDRLEAGLAAIAEVVERAPVGARALGAHLEGPYLSTMYAGAHDRRQLRPFDPAEWDLLYRAARGHLRIVTVAPEAPGNSDAVATAKRSGCVVSIGHSDATFGEARAAVAAGATLATHTFNAMRPLHHREPGLLGAVLDDSKITAELIADGVHVHSAVVRLLVRVKGADRIAAVTDAAWMAGLSPGLYRWEERDVRYDGLAPRLITGDPRTDGTLAGSGITADAALRFLVVVAGIPLIDAVRMWTGTPAAVLGEQSRLGSLRVGSYADLVVLDRDLRVRATVARGHVVFDAGTRSAPAPL